MGTGFNYFSWQDVDSGANSLLRQWFQSITEGISPRNRWRVINKILINMAVQQNCL